MPGKAPRKSPAIWLNPEFETIIRECVDNLVDRQVNRLKSDSKEQHQDQTDKLKEALKLVLLNRKLTIKKAMVEHGLSASARTLFGPFLREIKHKLVQLLGEKELQKDVVEEIETRRQNGGAVTFSDLWRIHGGHLRTAHTLGFTKSTAAAGHPPVVPSANPTTASSGIAQPAAASTAGNTPDNTALQKRINQLEAELKRERDENATLKQRISALEAQCTKKEAEVKAPQSQGTQVLPAQDQQALVSRLRAERNAFQDQCRQLKDQIDDLSTELNAKLQEAIKMRDHFESTLADLFGLGAKGEGHEKMPVADKFKEELRQWNSGPARTLESQGPIGNGAHGSVSCERLEVAIKRMDVEENQDMVDYYFREACVSHILRHPNMAPTLMRYFEDGELCLVMPYYRAGSLHSITKNVLLPLGEAAHVAHQLLLYLQYLHEKAKFLHRDIKEDNVLVADDGTLKVADLGLCGPIDNRRTGVGTPEYLAPEAVRNRLEDLKQLLTSAVDIYSLGMLMYKLLMKRYPHREVANPPKTNNTAAWDEWQVNIMKETCQPDFHDRVKAELQRKKNLTDDCRTFILDCLKPEPKQRPSASELLGYRFIETRQSAPWDRRVATWLRNKHSGV